MAIAKSDKITDVSESPQGRKLADIDPSERPREKALKYGFEALSNAELLALILRTGTVEHSIVEVCSSLFDSVDNSFCLLMRKSMQELKQIPGIGDVKAQQVLAIMEMVRRFAEEERSYKPKIISSSKDIYDLLKYEIGNKPHEEIWLLTLTRRNAVLNRYPLTRGSSTASIFDTKMILKKAILDDSSAIVLAHNHPSGNLRPSPQDDQITRALKNAAATMDIRLLDHLIVTTSGYYSYADQGRI